MTTLRQRVVNTVLEGCMTFFFPSKKETMHHYQLFSVKGKDKEKLDSSTVFSGHFTLVVL